MSLNTAGSRGQSPMSSGRSSPQPRRRLDEDPTKKDPKYKRFSASIDRALALFESNSLQEWADYISFLGRLLKALQSHPSLPLIPSKSLVAQRLAQCLNPRLPSGVHQKTIEVYSYIFSLIGRDGLSADLALWTPGLTPVLSYASLTLKPHYLDLLERFYLPIGTGLRPALKALVLALLPGIDEEGGEYFDKTLALIDAIRREVKDDAYFWQCVLLATITAPARRQGALAFLGRRLPKLDGASKDGVDGDGKTDDDRKAEVEALINPEPGLLVRAFCAGLRDEQLLVQRGFLDLLVTEIPLSAPVLQEKVSKADLQLLLTSAASVVLRRDMSLNRRLWSWYLGPEGSSSQAYFEKYGLQGLVDGLSKMLHLSEATPAERAQPYRICLSLMDRWEVGSLVAPKLFFPAIESLREFEKNAPNRETYGEVFRSASMFFNGVEAGLIWGQILDKIKTAFSEGGHSERATEHLQTVRFIIRTFNVREDEMVLVHAPMAVLAILRYLGDDPKEDTQELWRNGFLLAEEIWGLVPETAFKVSATASSHPTAEPSRSATESSILEAIHNFYQRLQVRSGNGKIIPAPLSSLQAAEWIVKYVASAVQKSINGDATGIDVDIRCRLFVHVLRKVPKLSDWPGVQSLVSSFLSKLQMDPVSVPFGALRGMANIVAAMYSKGYLDIKDTDALVASVTSGLWSYLSPDVPKFHVEAVKALWNLQGALGDRRIEAAIATVMTSSNSPGAEPGRNFAVLWMHSVGSISGNAYHVMLTRPLFLFLDALADDGLEISIFARGWVQTLPSINKLFWIFVEKLLGFRFLKDPGARDSDGAPRKRPIFEEDDCLEIATYYFQTLLNILRYATTGIMAQLATEMVVNGDERKAEALSQRGYGEEDMTLQTFFAKVAVRAIDGDAAGPHTAERVSKLHKMALGVLQQLLLSPYSKPLADMELEDILTARLISIIDTKETYVQVALLEVLHEALKLSLNRPTSHLGYLRQLSRNSDTTKAIETEKVAPPPQFTPPQQLLKCLIAGFSSPSSRPVLDSWIIFLGECLPLVTDVIFQMVIPLVECLCSQIQITFDSLKAVFQDSGASRVPDYGRNMRSPESTLVALLNGLEQILAAAHAKLLDEELKSAGPKSLSPDAPSSGFFGNMVSGVFSIENPQNRSAAANNRLTVLLCFQDTVKICYSIWSWSDASGNSLSGSLDAASKESWGYTSLRMKGRARRILEHMFAAETLECLETLIELWPGRLAPLGARERTVGSVFRLINVLDGSRPKHTIPAIFNAIYSRTNPSALDPSRRSTLTAELSDVDVVVFLVEYARSLEPDAMDEIWADCMVFLRDVLTNPFPHRQILPSLLSFTAILGEKVDDTNFGEQRKLRKELGDLFLRMLTAVFAVAPAGSRMLERSASMDRERMDLDGESQTPAPRPSKVKPVPDDIVPILASIIPELRKVVVEPDRVITASVSISTSLMGPIFRSKAFPQNVTPALLDLVYQLARLQNNQKAWKKELSDAFLDPRFFHSSPALVKEKWVPLAKQYILADRERMTELLSRITPPTTAGVLFGVGAASARQEADRKTALNLKRIAFLIYAADHDTFVPKLQEIEDKLVELLSATAVSSPSSATRGEIYLVLRALALRTSPVHLSSLWPLLNSELHNALVALTPDGDPEHTFADTRSILHACKLLDLLLVLAPDEFQLHEWLFVTDTIEAVYHPHDWSPMALVDQVVLEMQVGSRIGTSAAAAPYEIGGKGGRKPWFRGREEATLSGEVDVKRDVIAPFLRNLSIASYEGTYAMGQPDLEGCEDALVADLFEEAAVDRAV